MIDAGGVGLTQLTADGGSDPAWLPGGGKIGYLDSRSRQVVVIDAAGGVLPIPAIGLPASASGATWSPDGTKIAHTDPASRNLFTINADGTEPQLVATGGSAPAWSPDSTKIAYVDSSSSGAIFAINAGGGGLAQISQGRGSDPAWSPDGERIAYVDRSRQMVVTDAAGAVSRSRSWVLLQAQARQRGHRTARRSRMWTLLGGESQ